MRTPPIKEAVLDIARSERVAAVTTTGTDVAVSSIGYVCRELGLCGISEQAARVLTDKALMKEAFVNGGVTTAEFRRVEAMKKLSPQPRLSACRSCSRSSTNPAAEE